ncbi:MAG: hypothetical protein ABIB12_01230 [Patescibacteria group bacterium]
MTKRQRTCLFFTLAALFLLTAPAVALYAQGYRVDWERRTLTQTGAFYFKAVPTRVDISINGEHVKTTDFLFGSTLTKNFLPRQYQVRLTKEGYHPWEKTLDITENTVTEAKHIVLFPEEIEYRRTGEAERMWPSPDRKKLLLQEDSNLVAWDLESGKRTLLWQQQENEELEEVQWAQNSERVLLEIAQREQLNRQVVFVSGESGPCGELPCNLAFLKGTEEKVLLAPSSTRAVISRTVGTSRILQEVDYKEQRILSSWGNDVLTFQLFGNELFFLESTGQVIKASLSAPSSWELLLSVPFPARREAPYEILSYGDRLLLKEGTSLFLLEDGEFQRIADSVQSVVPSPDGTKLALAGNAELWILYLKDQEEQPSHKVKDKVFLTRLSQRISAPVWITPFMFAFGAGEEVFFSETDDRDGLNIYGAGMFKKPELFWNTKEKSLMILSDGTLSASEKLGI